MKDKNRGDTDILRPHNVSPADIVRERVKRFSEGNVEKLVSLHAPDAVNHQVVTEPLVGREAIHKLFETEFGRAEMVCIQENLFESCDWAILEWSDPKGIRGCGLFHVVNGQIVFQRGYFDQLTFFKLQGLPVPEHYLSNNPSKEN